MNIGTGIEVYSSDVLAAIGGKGKEELAKRGLNVYTSSELIGISGRDKNGQHIQGLQEVPLFGLSIMDRIMISQRCDAVYGVITGRMQRISGLEWSVQRESKEADRIELYLKQCKQIFEEYSDPGLPIKYAIIKAKMLANIMEKLPDITPDIKNFGAALLRWKKRIEQTNDNSTTEIEDWLHQPNAHDNFSDYTKKFIYDLMTHGGAAEYKEYADGALQNLYILPGGTVTPLKSRYVGPLRMFSQVVPGLDPKIYFSDEIIHTIYMPTSGIGYGLIPLEALVNKVAEVLLFDQMAAQMADGTMPPQKIAVFGGEKVPFGDLNGDEQIEVPLERAEESRLETLLNEPRKNAIRVLSGQGTPAILDLSRADTYQYQNERQKDIREAVALVYNATNMEMNLSGADATSGRSTSEAQADISKERGIYPLVKILENNWNLHKLPLRFGSGFIFQYKSGLSEQEQADLDMKMMQTGTYPVNEIRIKRGDEPLGPEHDTIQGGGQPSPPDGSQGNPFNMRGI